eukprot:3671022-Prymnesium_polylepis.1
MCIRDRDCSGTIDVDECMEILFRRFGKDALENKVTAFMANDADEDQTISFTEFLAMDKRNDTQGTRNHSGRTRARVCGPEQPGARDILLPPALPERYALRLIAALHFAQASSCRLVSCKLPGKRLT